MLAEDIGVHIFELSPTCSAKRERRRAESSMVPEPNTCLSGRPEVLQ